MIKKGISLSEKYRIAKRSEDIIREYSKVASISFIYIGKELKKIKDDKLYKYLGEGSPEYESFENYLSSPNINIDLRKAYYLIKIYDTFVLKFGYKPEELSEMNWTALRSILPCVTKDNVANMIEKTKLLTRSHLEQEVKLLKTGMTSMDDLDQHKHSWVKCVFWKCTECGERSNVEPKDGEMV